MEDKKAEDLLGKKLLAKCPICGNDYSLKTGYCVVCKKKVGDIKASDEDLKVK